MRWGYESTNCYYCLEVGRGKFLAETPVRLLIFWVEKFAKSKKVIKRLVRPVVVYHEEED